MGTFEQKRLEIISRGASVHPVEDERQIFVVDFISNTGQRIRGHYAAGKSN
jgi:hypothetical protein